MEVAEARGNPAGVGEAAIREAAVMADLERVRAEVAERGLEELANQ